MGNSIKLKHFYGIKEYQPNTDLYINFEHQIIFSLKPYINDFYSQLKNTFENSVKSFNIEYNSIISVNFYTLAMNKQILNTLSTIVGGVIAGGAGAIIGSSLNKTKTIEQTFIEISYKINNCINYIILLDSNNNINIIQKIKTYIVQNNTNVLIQNIPFESSFLYKIQNKNENTSIDIPEQIKKLAELKDSGVLTEEEFVSKKQELLARL